ncbi:MAG: adenosine kinase [Myxococcota bacterium]
MTKFDVTGIGNAIVDVLAHADDAFISNQGLHKGGMALIDATRAEDLYRLMGDTVEISGGSAANTIAGVAALGSKAAYIGKVADDPLGETFRKDIRATGSHYEVAPLRAAAPTARCLILVTPDGQRTMNTFLGASQELTPADVDASLIQEAKVTYLEGYLWDPPKAKEAFVQAASIAHDAGREVSLSLSDAFCVDRHRDSFLDLIDSHVDILFANETEITSLYQVNSFEEAASKVAGQVKIAALTRSEEGSLIIVGGDRFQVPAEPVAKVVDTTGAGDLYAAGFLYGHCRGFSPADCGRVGSIAAAEIIGHFGARPEVDLKTLLPAELR